MVTRVPGRWQVAAAWGVFGRIPGGCRSQAEERRVPRGGAGRRKPGRNYGLGGTSRRTGRRSAPGRQRGRPRTTDHERAPTAAAAAVAALASATASASAGAGAGAGTLTSRYAFRVGVPRHLALALAAAFGGTAIGTHR